MVAFTVLCIKRSSPSRFLTGKDAHLTNTSFTERRRPGLSRRGTNSPHSLGSCPCEGWPFEFSYTRASSRFWTDDHPCCSLHYFSGPLPCRRLVTFQPNSTPRLESNIVAGASLESVRRTGYYYRGCNSRGSWYRDRWLLGVACEVEGRFLPLLGDFSKILSHFNVKAVSEEE